MRITRITAILLIACLLAVVACASPTSIPQPLAPTEQAPSTPTPNPTPSSVPTPAPFKGNLDVYFIDVGQGDSILIDQGQTEVLIDCGTASPGVTNFLKQYVDGPLEGMVATHTDADHIGGLAAVLNSFNVLDVWTNGQSVSTATYTTFAGAVKGSGASTHVGRRGDKIAVGQLSFSILNPIDLTGTTNNNSIVLSLNWGDTGFLFEGDAEQGAESSMLSAGIVPHAEILKVGHHGSRTASSPPFLAVVKPEVAVYMAGVGNRYGHPHIETIDALYQIGAKVYGTDVNGTIKIETDGKTYTVQPSKGTANMPKAVGQTPSLTSLSPTSNKVAATDDGPFVGSKNSNVYHYPSCSSAKRISPPNLITFNSSADACSHGYRPCEICKPP